MVIWLDVERSFMGMCGFRIAHSNFINRTTFFIFLLDESSVLVSSQEVLWIQEELKY